MAHTIGPSSGVPGGPADQLEKLNNKIIHTWPITLSPPQEPPQGPESNWGNRIIYLYLLELNNNTSMAHNESSIYSSRYMGWTRICTN